MGIFLGWYDNDDEDGDDCEDGNDDIGGNTGIFFLICTTSSKILH